MSVASGLLRSGATIAAFVALVATAPTASAQYTQTLPGGSGTASLGSTNGTVTTPGSTFTIGTFTGIPSGTITSATLSGTFGQSAPAQLFLNSVMVAECQYDNNCEYSAGTPFSFTFGPTNFAALAGPTAAFTATPTDASANGNQTVVVGATTLTITYAGTPSTVPEPTSVALLATGLVTLVPTLRRRR